MTYEPVLSRLFWGERGNREVDREKYHAHMLAGHTTDNSLTT